MKATPMNNDSTLSVSRRLIDALTMFMVSTLSIALLLFVGHGEALRNYERFQIERLIAQGELVQDSIDAYLRPGLPIRQFAGFGMLAEPVMTSDSSVKSIDVTDPADQPIFEYGDKVSILSADGKMTDNFRHEVRRVGDVVQAIMPLRNRFESVGNLVLTMNVAEIHSRVDREFAPLVFVGFIASILFTIFAFLFEPYIKTRGTRWLKIGFAIAFMVVAAGLVYTLTSLYSTGLQAKARSIAAALAGRVDDVAQVGIDYADIDGLDDILADFRRLNPEASALAIIIDGKSFIHTDKSLAGKPWVSTPGTHEIAIPLTAQDATKPIFLRVDILKSGIYWQVARAIKNFAALFLASALFAGFFMELARVLQKRVVAKMTQNDNPDDAGASEKSLARDIASGSLVKPAFFLTVFIESLAYPFLPQITYQAAHDAGVAGNLTSLPFILYYFFFAAALVPAGRFENTIGSRRLISLGLLISGASYIGLAMNAAFAVLVMSRACAGIGQGLLFIGVQTYVLKNATHGNRTQAAGIIVFGYQAGTLSGMAIGSLLITQLGTRGVFQLAAFVAAITSLYVITIIPKTETTILEPLQRAKRGVFKELGMMLRDSQFLRSMAFIGVPAKSIMTGVILFTLPLLLSKHGLANEDIGQITMAYAASVLWASNVVARRADKNGGIKNILFLGALLSSAGLLAIAAGGRIDVPFWSIATIVAGVVLVGIAHGFINAPVVTHVSDSEVSSKVGAPAVAATYRLLERVGHVVGPGLMGQMLLVFGQDFSTLFWIAGGVAGLAFLFAATDRSPMSTEAHVEMSR
jgi:predicted MFS family arabinose efflux permease